MSKRYSYNLNPTPTRAEAWKRATFIGLVAAAVVLVIVKMFTAVAFAPAALVALVVFFVAFSFALRLTPIQR